MFQMQQIVYEEPIHVYIALGFNTTHSIYTMIN